MDEAAAATIELRCRIPLGLVLAVMQIVLGVTSCVLVMTGMGVLENEDVYQAGVFAINNQLLVSASMQRQLNMTYMYDQPRRCLLFVPVT